MILDNLINLNYIRIEGNTIFFQPKFNLSTKIRLVLNDIIVYQNNMELIEGIEYFISHPSIPNSSLKIENEEIDLGKKISKKSKIYILTVSHYQTGGIEALYQLADAINTQGGEATTVFFNTENNPFPDRYKKYSVNYINFCDVEWDENNILVVPEIWTERFHDTNIQMYIWWLSVDNNYDSFHRFSDEKIMNLYQSNYALQHLINNNTINYLPLYDYIDEIDLYNYDLSTKKDIVCYNPVKGKEITDKIILENPQFEYVPLINMSSDEIISTLKTSKVYIDFGHHPGKDRIPREAALAGNCVITSRIGSSNYFTDLPIPTKFKLDDVSNIGQLINDCFINHEKNLRDFRLLRNEIKNQKEEFFNQVKKIFIYD